MTSELMLKVTIVFLVASVASYVMLNVTMSTMDVSEVMRIIINKQHILKHPFVVVVSISSIITKVAAAVCAVATAVLWLMGV